MWMKRRREAAGMQGEMDFVNNKVKDRPGYPCVLRGEPTDELSFEYNYARPHVDFGSFDVCHI